MPVPMRTIAQAAFLSLAALSFSSEAFAISKACKSHKRPDRTAANEALKGFMPRYTLGECMVRLKLDFHKGVRPVAVTHQMGKEIARYLYANKPSAALYYFERGMDGYHYMLYANECPSRYEITQSMINAVQPCFAGEIDIKMLKGEVIPSLETYLPPSTEWTDSSPE